MNELFFLLLIITPDCLLRSEAKMDPDSWEFIFMEDVKSHIEEHGVSGMEEFFKTKLRRWKDVEINIGVTGDSGVGKSSFINAIRG